MKFIVSIGIHKYFHLILFTLIFFSKESFAQTKPNIIFVLTDDHRWDALGAMGNRIIQTPNLDDLAKHGLLFRNAYVTTSICCVSRASILTGQYESRHQINDFSTDLSSNALEQTYPLLLKKSGYKIGFVGKYGVGQAHQPKASYDYWTCTEKTQPDYLMSRGNGDTIHNTDSVGNDILKFLDKFAGKEPFCLSVGFKAPHEQDGNPPEFIVQKRFRNLYKDVFIPEPVTADPKYWNSFPDFFRTDSNIARERWKPLFSNDAQYQQTVKNYYRLITGVDEIIGKMMDKLKVLGIAENTVIVFMGDNGFYLGEHGMEGKWYGHEESIRVPLIIYDPRQKSIAKKSDEQQIALNIDIAPTLLAFAGVPAPPAMQGHNLLEKSNTPRKDFFYEHNYLGGNRIPKSEGVVSKNYKYLKYTDYNYEELYDLRNDPHETVNLSNNPTYKKVLKDLRNRYEVLKMAVK